MHAKQIKLLIKMHITLEWSIIHCASFLILVVYILYVWKIMYLFFFSDSQCISLWEMPILFVAMIFVFIIPPLICFHYILSTHCKMWIRRKLLRILIYHQYIYSHCISDLPVIIILPFFVLWQKWQTSHWKHDNDIKTTHIN